MEESRGQNINNQTEEDPSKRRQMEREEYMRKLKKWLDDARLWHYNAIGLCYNNQQGSRDAQQHFANIYASFAQNHLWNQNLHNILRQTLPNNDGFINMNDPNLIYQTPNHTSQPTTVPPRSYEFIIPPLWKRMVAELLDFLILFLVKMTLTFLLLESFDITDVEFRDLEEFQKNLENPDVAVPIAMELLTLELLHRLIVCVYETYFLYGKICATPGKKYMGLMVVTAETISPVPGRRSETVTATGASPLDWQKSLIRSALKNLFVGLFLPLCIAFYIFPHNRTSYDMMANSIVVEYHQEFMVDNPAI